MCKYRFHKSLYHQHLNHGDHDHHDHGHDKNYNDHDYDDNEQEVGLGVLGALAASVTEPLPGAALHKKTVTQVQCTELYARYTALHTPGTMTSQVHCTAHKHCTQLQCNPGTLQCIALKSIPLHITKAAYHWAQDIMNCTAYLPSVPGTLCSVLYSRP